jgi:putative heme degradation protein
MILAQTTIAKPPIVMVQDALADGTSWQHIIQLLEREGYSVMAVHTIHDPNFRGQSKLVAQWLLDENSKLYCRWVQGATSRMDYLSEK